LRVVIVEGLDEYNRTGRIRFRPFVVKTSAIQLFQPLTQLPTPLRILSFALMVGLPWAAIALPVGWLIKDPNRVSLITMPILYLIFLGMLYLWGRFGYGENLLRRYGMRRSTAWIYEWLGGLGMGYGIVLLLFELQGAIGWVRWFNPVRPIPGLLLEGLLVAVVVGLAEELLFRGWLLDELTRRYQPNVALAVTSVIYAVLHCLRLVPASVQWVSLALLGWALGMAKRVTGDRLGMAAGLHTGLIWCYWVLKTGVLFEYTNKVPEAITGWERNPLAGPVGIVVMAIVAISFTQAWTWQKQRSGLSSYEN
jgi:uncharacterized protein